MAIIHRAQIRPTKLELIGAWLADRSWHDGSAVGTLRNVGAYRFDDPAGRVGVETILVGTERGATLQVPVTFRDAPLPGGEAWLMGTMEHTVLGTRWVYDACGDPVHVSTLSAAILGGGSEAEELVQVDGGQEARTPTASVRGTGTGDVVPAVQDVAELEVSTQGTRTTILAPGLELVVRRLVEPGRPADGLALAGTWAEQPEPVVLVTARLR